MYTTILMHIIGIANLIMFKLHDNVSMEYYMGIILFY